MQSNQFRPRRPQPLPLRRITKTLKNEAIMGFLELLNTPRALTVWLLYDHHVRTGCKAAAMDILELPCDPLDYTSAHSFALDYQATRLLSKFKGLKTGVDLAATAISAAASAEESCKYTNSVIRAYRSGNLRFLTLDETILSRIQGLIAETLNPESYIPVDGDVDVGWSSGRTTSAYGRWLDPISKYGSRMDVSVSALKWARALVNDCPNWVASVLNADGPCSALPSAFAVVEDNVMLTVPKSAKTDRVICYEPHMNIRLQLAVGGHIRALLRKKGVNLDDQTINRRRALRGSRDGTLATIDLRSASDTISLELVRLLLPLNWVLVLEDLRSKKTLWPDNIQRENEKFSSMGNGYTFELESLIFWAACQAVCRGGVSVFGDDIIIPTQHYDECVQVLNALGFIVNDQKSFSSGPFRESCGCDGFDGVEVTPIRLSDDITSVNRLVLFHNQVRRWASAHLPVLAVAQFLARLRDVVPYPVGPGRDERVDKEKGQGHYHVNWDEATPRRANHASTWCGWSYRQWVPVEKPAPVDYQAHMGFAALCAATGPKRLSNSYSSNSQRYTTWIRSDSWATTWPSILWVT